MLPGTPGTIRTTSCSTSPGGHHGVRPAGLSERHARVRWHADGRADPGGVGLPEENLATGDPGPPGARHKAIGRSEEHTSELQSLMRISYSFLCLKHINIIPS